MIIKYMLGIFLLSGLCWSQQTVSDLPAGSLAGSVMSVDGTPVISKIFIYQIYIEDGLAHPVARCSANTTPEGNYECPVPPGRYLVIAKPDRTSPNSAQAEHSTPGARVATDPISYPVGFYPHAAVLAEAELLSIKPGEHGTANVILSPQPAADIKGSILGKPKVVRIHLSLHCNDYDLPSSFSIDYDSETGSFIARNVPSGEYLLDAYWFADGATRHASRSVNGGSAPKNIVLQENASVSVRGTVSLDGVAAKFPSSVTLQCGPWGGKQRYISTVSDNGSFLFSSIPASDCSLESPSAEQVYIRSLTESNNKLTVQRFTLKPPVMKLGVELSNRKGSVQGTVTGLEPGSGKAGIVAQFLESGEVKTVPVDMAGKFSIAGVPAGDYRLYALPNLREAEYRNPAYLRILQGESTTVTVPVDETIFVELNTISEPARATSPAAF